MDQYEVDAGQREVAKVTASIEELQAAVRALPIGSTDKRCRALDRLEEAKMWIESAQRDVPFKRSLGVL